MSKRQENKSQLIREIEKLKPHDHLCLIYESEEEWKEAAIPYISIGLASGQKCIYVCDNHTASNLRQLLEENGTDVSAFESSGQLVITQESDTYTRGGKFDPDLMIGLLIEETEKALSHGYSALRVTGEMTWVLKGRPGSERLLEYEAKLNRDLLPEHACLAICQYDRWKFAPEIIKGVIMTHPKLIYGTRVSDNFYYIPTEEFLNHKRAEVEAQHWLNNIAREEKRKEELEKSETRYRRLFEAAKDGILILDADSGIIRDINPYLLDLMGYSKQEILGKRLWELGLFKDRLRSQDSFRELQEKGYIHYEDLPLETKEGSKVDVEFVSNSYPVNSHTVIQCNIRNITERKKAEDALREERSLFVGGPTVVFKWAAAEGWPIEYVSPNVYDMLGYTSRELTESKRLFSELIHPDDLPRVVEEYNRCIDEDCSPFVSEYRVLDKNGTVLWLHEHTIPIRDEKGEVIRNHGYVTDITDRKKAEETLSEKAFLLDSSSAIIGTCDLDGKMTYANLAFLKHLGFDTLDEVLGRQFTEFWMLQQQFEEVMTALIGEGGPRQWSGELKLKRKDGSLFDVHASATAVLDNSGKPIELMSTSIDITGRKKAEEEKRELERKAQVSSRLASVGEMASGVAHEINNPLTGVIGFSELLMEKDLPEDFREEVRIIHDGSKRVADIVKRLLSFARQQKPVRTRTDINEIVENTLALRKYALETGNIEVITSLDPDLPWMVADIGQLQQVFMNIIVNAEAEMKRAHGRGKLTVKTEQANDMIRISFQDTGPGIAKKKQDKIFDPFFTTKDVGEGTGLGLSLSYGIVAEHKGNLYVESRKGKGATFFVELPIIAEAEQLEMDEPEAPQESERTGGRILVIDDEPNILSFLKEVLAREGYDVETADNGREALEMIRNTRYSAILCDIKLPELSGIAVFKEIGKIASSLKKRLIFITGDVIGADTAAFLKKTGAPYINKPVDTKLLKRELNRLITGVG